MYTVIEMQNGIVGNNVWTFNSEEEAYSKYYAVLSVAAVSSVPVHGCMVVTAECNLIASRYFQHNVNP